MLNRITSVKKQYLKPLTVCKQMNCDLFKKIYQIIYIYYIYV